MAFGGSVVVAVGLGAGCGGKSSDAAGANVDAGCALDSSVAFLSVDGGTAACQTCITTNCSSAVSACENDCTCESAALGALGCIGDLGSSATASGIAGCVSDLADASDSPLAQLSTCVSTCTSACIGVIEGGVDATAEASVDSGTSADSGQPETGANDAGADSSSPVEASAEGGTDAADDAAPPLGPCSGTLLSDCSFETPVASLASYQLFSNAQSIRAWTVVGATGNVATLNTTFMQNGYTFQAQDGQQSMDLTGTSNTPTGVAQTVTTSVGTDYQLSFWVGNVVNPTGIFGISSTVLVQVNGTMVYSADNSSGTAGMLDWQEYSLTFTATSTSTTIGFINGDPSSDTSNMLDNVTLVALP